LISYITARTAKAIAVVVAAVGLTAVAGATVAAPAVSQASSVAAGLHVAASGGDDLEHLDNTQWHSYGH
jgi:predicted PurR-regulated permease PerM